MNRQIFEKAMSLMDEANRKDPNVETADGQEWPKELLYSKRMTETLTRYQPGADDVIKLAVHGQHIERWKSPRNAYPMNRQGYHQWRNDLYKFHAGRVADVMLEAGCDEASRERARRAVGKIGIKANKDTQLLEDVAGMVFFEYYMSDFAEKHPDYDEDKWISIIRKTWKKMSSDAHEFILGGKIRLPESLSPLFHKAVSSGRPG